MLAAALSYAARGWPVFPVDGKIPLTPRGFKDATADAGIVTAAFGVHHDAGVAIATGAESGLLVLDEDTGHGGGRTRVALEAKLGKLPRTFAVLTGGGGKHYYFSILADRCRAPPGNSAPALTSEQTAATSWRRRAGTRAAASTCCDESRSRRTPCEVARGDRRR